MVENVFVLFYFMILLSIVPLALAFMLHKTHKKTAWVLYAVTSVMLLLQISMWADDVVGWQTHRHFTQIQELLERPFEAFYDDIVVKGHGVIALSNIAEGLVNYGIRHPTQHEVIVPLLHNALTLATHPNMRHASDIANPSASGENGLFLTHVNIILGAYQRFSGDTQYVSVNQHISEYLATTTLQDHQKHVHSYPEVGYKWPADQAATLYSLYLFDRNNGTTLSVQPIQEWLAYMKTEGTDGTTGLHYSEVSKTIEYWKYPRGCALSWTVKYMSRFAPEDAQQLWARYKGTFKQNYWLAAGFREYAKGVERPQDYDSGPIILGNGAAATAFGLSASRGLHDMYTYYQLYNSLKMTDMAIAFMSVAGHQSLYTVSQDVLATSIRFSSETTIEWYPRL